MTIQKQAMIHDVLGMKHVYKATAAQTGGTLSVFEAEVPSGCGAPLHRHARDSELFYVLEGELTFVSTAGQRVCRAGEVVYLAAGGEHAFHNASASPARAAVVVTPGSEAEGFFGAIDREQRECEMNVDVVKGIAARFGITVLAA